MRRGGLPGSQAPDGTRNRRWRGVGAWNHRHHCAPGCCHRVRELALPDHSWRLSSFSGVPRGGTSYPGDTGPAPPRHGPPERSPCGTPGDRDASLPGGRKGYGDGAMRHARPPHGVPKQSTDQRVCTPGSTPGRSWARTRLLDGPASHRRKPPTADTPSGRAGVMADEPKRLRPWLLRLAAAGAFESPRRRGFRRSAVPPSPRAADGTAPRKSVDSWLGCEDRGEGTRRSGSFRFRSLVSRN